MNNFKTAILIGSLSLLPFAALAADTAKTGKGDERRAAMFAKADADKDGKLSKEEFNARVQQRSDKFFDKFDTNKDGKITKDELNAVNKERTDKRFAEIDTNKDGFASKEELKAYHDKNPRGAHYRGGWGNDDDKKAE